MRLVAGDHSYESSRAGAADRARSSPKHSGNGEVVEVDWLACGMTAETCLMELKARQGSASILLVGHEPDFSETIAAMLGVTIPAPIKVRKAALTGIGIDSIFRSAKGSCIFWCPPGSCKIYDAGDHPLIKLRR